MPSARVAVFPHLRQVEPEVVEYLIDLFEHFGVLTLRFLKDLADLFDKLNRDFREVIHEIQRILNFVRNPGGQLAERGQFFLGDDLFLSLVQPFQGLLQILVLDLDFLRQLLDQVQPLHLQGMAPENLQRVRHIGDLVVARNGNRGFQVAARHIPHGRGKTRQASNQVSPHKQPADEHRAGNAQ